MREKSSQKSAKNSNLQLKVPKIVPLKGPQKNALPKKSAKKVLKIGTSLQKVPKKGQKKFITKKSAKKKHF